MKLYGIELDEGFPKEKNYIATEATQDNTIRHTMKEEYIIRDKYFPYIESFIPKTEHLLFRHIAKYEDKNNAILTSPYPSKNLIFGINEGGEDNDILFRCTQIDRNEMKADIKKMPLPGNLTKEKAAFQPTQIVMYLIIRYYMLTKQFDKAKIIYSYYGYSIYWKRWKKSFRYGVNEDIMISTVNNMTYRNLIKKLGSVKALLEYIVQHIFEYYVSGVAQSCDEDIRYILDQVQSDIGSKVNSIASAYYEEHKKGQSIITGKMTYDDDEGNARLDTSNTSIASVQAQKYTQDFYSNSIDPNRVKSACLLSSEVSQREVLATIEYIHSEVPIHEIRELYSSIFFYYLNCGDPKANEKSIQSFYFMATMKEVVKKGNSINKNILSIISLLNKWLEAGSKTFRLTTRDGTKTNYRKAIFNYFLLCVTNR